MIEGGAELERARKAPNVCAGARSTGAIRIPLRRAWLSTSAVILACGFWLFAAPNPARADGGHLLHRWLRFSKYYGEGGMTLAQIADAFPDGLLGREIEWWGHAAAFAYPPGMWLAEVMQPVLLLNPDDDLRDFTLRAPGLLQNGREVRLDGWGHGFLDVHTAEVAALVGGFLDEF